MPHLTDASLNVLPLKPDAKNRPIGWAKRTLRYKSTVKILPPPPSFKRKGKDGRLLRRPQQAHPSATVVDFLTAVLRHSGRSSAHLLARTRLLCREGSSPSNVVHCVLLTFPVQVLPLPEVAQAYYPQLSCLRREPGRRWPWRWWQRTPNTDGLDYPLQRTFIDATQARTPRP